MPSEIEAGKITISREERVFSDLSVEEELKEQR